MVEESFPGNLGCMDQEESRSPNGGKKRRNPTLAADPVRVPCTIGSISAAKLPLGWPAGWIVGIESLEHLIIPAPKLSGGERGFDRQEPPLPIPRSSSP